MDRLLLTEEWLRKFSAGRGKIHHPESSFQAGVIFSGRREAGKVRRVL
jgi:hypothetical protein